MCNDVSYRDIASRIDIYEDLDEVRIGSERYSQCMEQPVGCLAQWLYCDLHIGHPTFFDDFDINSGSLLDHIEHLIPASSVLQRAVPVPGTDLAMINGVAVRTEVANGTTSMPCLRPQLSPGFCMFIHTDEQREHGKFPLWRYYLSESSADSALADWQAIVAGLVNSGLSFSTKVLSNIRSYPRNDAIVVYCAEDSSLVEEWLIHFVETRPHLFDSQIHSLLCQQLVGCLSKGEEPITDFGEQQSFGENRCSAIAYAIQDHLATGLAFSTLLKQRFIDGHINPENISQNLALGDKK